MAEMFMAKLKKLKTEADSPVGPAAAGRKQKTEPVSYPVAAQAGPEAAERISLEGMNAERLSAKIEDMILRTANGSGGVRRDNAVHALRMAVDALRALEEMNEVTRHALQTLGAVEAVEAVEAGQTGEPKEDA